MPINRRFKCYVGLGSTRPKLEWLLDRFRFAPCGEVLRCAGLLEQEQSSVASPVAVPVTPSRGSLAGSGTSAASPVRILILNQYFWPDVAATAQHAFDLAKFLEERGDRVTVIASRSVYGRSSGALPHVEVHGGIEIHRVGSSLFGRRGLLLRLFDFGAFNIACLFKQIDRYRQLEDKIIIQEKIKLELQKEERILSRQSKEELEKSRENLRKHAEYLSFAEYH
jgi:hypothetical protein